MSEPKDNARNSGEMRCYALLRDMHERHKIERFFDHDGMVCVGWKDTREPIVCIGTNTEFNRELGDFIADSCRKIV